MKPADPRSLFSFLTDPLLLRASPPAEPHLSADAKRVVKEYGDWRSFLMTYGLKATDADQAEEGRRIAETMGEHDAEERREQQRQHVGR